MRDLQIHISSPLLICDPSELSPSSSKSPISPIFSSSLEPAGQNGTHLEPGPAHLHPLPELNGSASPPSVSGSTDRQRRSGSAPTSGEMITRSKLVEQLREYQIRSQHKWPIIHKFSPKPQIITRKDVIVALSFGLLFCLLMISSYLMLYYRYFKVSAVIICPGILLPVCLKISRKRMLARKRERRMLLPLSM